MLFHTWIKDFPSFIVTPAGVIWAGRFKTSDVLQMNLINERHARFIRGGLVFRIRCCGKGTYAADKGRFGQPLHSMRGICNLKKEWGRLICEYGCNGLRLSLPHSLRYVASFRRVFVSFHKDHPPVLSWSFFRTVSHGLFKSMGQKRLKNWVLSIHLWK